MRKITTATIAVVALLIVLTAGAALGSSRFVDVPTDHVHVNAIEWAAENGITHGCNPPANDKFCPDEPITRGQMASMLQRAIAPTNGPDPVAFYGENCFEDEVVVTVVHDPYSIAGSTLGCVAGDDMPWDPDGYRPVK